MPAGTGTVDLWAMQIVASLVWGTRRTTVKWLQIGRLLSGIERLPPRALWGLRPASSGRKIGSSANVEEVESRRRSANRSSSTTFCQIESGFGCQITYFLINFAGF